MLDLTRGKAPVALMILVSGSWPRDAAAIGKVSDLLKA